MVEFRHVSALGFMGGFAPSLLFVALLFSIAVASRREKRWVWYLISGVLFWEGSIWR